MIPRPVRVAVPARAEFSGNRFLIQELTANMSEGGIFLVTDQVVEPGSRGRLTLQVTPWDKPFTVEAEVVRSASPDPNAADSRSGLGIEFINLSDVDRARLHRMVEGLRDGSVAEAIRRSIREAPHGILHELRSRPVDQKVILAISAGGEEIDALIRDGNLAVIKRLLENPRVNIPHIRKIARDPRISTSLLLMIKRRREWFSDEEVRYLFCLHPKAPAHEAIPVLKFLNVARLKQLALHPNTCMAVRDKAKELLRKKRIAV